MLGLPRRALRVVRLVMVLGYWGAWGLAPPPAAAQRWIDEAKLGMLVHDINAFGLGWDGEPSADINIELLFPSPAFLRIFGAPRPHLGVSVNTVGQTDVGYVGLTWSGRPWRSRLALPEALFIAGTLGGGAHDGYLNKAPPGRKRLGSRLLFRQSVEMGYQLTSRVSVSALFGHMSNGWLAHHNESLNQLGMRVGWLF